MPELVKCVKDAIGDVLNDYWDSDARQFAEGYEQACAEAAIRAVGMSLAIMVEPQPSPESTDA
jgi:hypothetical protein